MVLPGLCLALLGLVEPASARTLAIAPLAVDGPLPEAFAGRAREGLLAGARRGSLEVVSIAEGRADACEDAPCLAALATTAGADYVLLPYLFVDDEQRGYRFTGRIVDATGHELFVVEEGCEVCGFEEAIVLVEDRLASTADRLARLDAEVTTAVVTGAPAGAAVTIDGTRVGRLPISQPVAPGPHRIAVSRPGFLTQSFEVDFPPGARKQLEVRLPVDPTADALARRRALTIAGATTGGLSIAALAAGGVLVGIHGMPYRRDCEADIAGNCRHLYGTRPAGIAAIVAGGVGLAVGIALLVVSRRGPKPRQGSAWSPRRASTIASRAAATSDPSLRAAR